MARKNMVGLVVVAVVCAAAGFFVGQVVNASFNSPGSANDPLVSQSYVETIVGERTATLQTQIEELQNQVVALGGGKVSASTTPNTNTNTGDNAAANEEKPATTSSKTVKVTGNSVNVRAEANTSASVVGQVAKDDELSVVAEDGDWYQVQLSDGTTGWIASWLVQ